MNGIGKERGNHVSDRIDKCGAWVTQKWHKSDRVTHSHKRYITMTLRFRKNMLVINKIKFILVMQLISIDTENFENSIIFLN